MNVEQARDDIDYEEDVAKLKRVWEEIKEPPKKAIKESLAKTQSATQTKIAQDSKPKPSKEKKNKVIVSEQNVKETIRNPKFNPATVIQVVTHPQKKLSDPIRNDKHTTAPERLILTNPERQIIGDLDSLRRQLANKDHELSLLRVSNTHNQDKIRRLEGEIELKDRTIDSLKARQRQLATDLASLNSRQLNFNYGKVQYQNYRQDSRRLLKMLKSTTEYNKFAQFALDDDGVRFLSNVNKTVKTRLDAPSDQAHFHFCTCNKSFIPEAGLWVPEKVHDFGKQFIKDREGNLSQTELELLLYELNKLWREREKRILNHLYATKAHEMGKYKRQIKDLSKSKGDKTRDDGKREE